MPVPRWWRDARAASITSFSGSLNLQVLVVELRILPAHREAFADALKTNAIASREGEPGCLQFDVCRDPADPGLFFLYELYQDEAVVQSQLGASHFLQMNAATASWAESKTVHRYVRVEP